MENSSFAGRIQDAELGHTRDGYAALAAWIAQDPDGEALVFRRFNQLTARNLLHLQSQLIILEKRLEKYDKEVFEGRDMDIRLASRRWETLLENAERPEERKTLELYKEIQDKVKEYRMLSHNHLNCRCNHPNPI